MYTVYLFTQGRGEGEGDITREKVRGTIVHKAGQKLASLHTTEFYTEFWNGLP
jgi:hypothetical protein